ncbi:sensor domain-containing diguanylate cyclase [Vreelandella lionensis]|uniref:sensor domain-containing diguanylate cyclase n=1 Tax=Vreelandella lionensis TaxID=1144478 RepID=UPI0009F1FEF3|nr:GGDEF domain-containing protein [Halomonas lionensis]
MTVNTAASETRYTTLADQLPSFISSTLLQCKRLPSLPAAALRVLNVARTADATCSDYAKAIEHDPALTARVMSVANSVHYLRTPQPSHTCFDATQRLGLDVTLATVLSFCLFEDDHDAHSRARFWQRAITAAAAASYLENQLCPHQSGSIFTTALLQDIGILALQKAYPADADLLYADDRSSHQHIIQVEKRYFGCDHTLVGAWLMAKWGAHDELINAIYHSHGSLETDDMAAVCLRMSGPIADAWLSANPSQAVADVLRQWRTLPTFNNWAVDGLLAHLQHTLPPLSNALGLSAPCGVDSLALLQNAQQLLFEHTLSLSARLDAQYKARETLLNDYAKLEQRSRIDPLTKLANRAWLEEQLRERFHLCLTTKRTMSVVFIDLDHFKVLNDQYGHQAGDRVLTHFGKTLTSLIRSGAVAGRYGGEEFLVILPDEDADSAKCFAERITRRLQERPMAHLDQKPVYVSVSIGVAGLNDGGFGNEQELIDAADQSMYFTKRSGRGGVSVYGH